MVRIVSLSPALTETLMLLGAADELVGVSVYCLDYAPGKPVAGTYISANWRVLERLKPDIVVLQDYVQRRLYKQLLERGYKAYILPLPTSLHGVAENAAALGGLVGRRVEGLELAERIEEQVAKLEAGKPARTVRAYVEYIWPDYRTRMSPGAVSFADHALRLAGLENIYSTTPQPFVEPNPDEVVRAKPQVIVVSAEKHMRLTVEKYLAKTPWLQKAAKDTPVIILGGGKGMDLAHPGPSILETVENLKKLVSQTLNQPLQR